MLWCGETEEAALVGVTLAAWRVGLAYGLSTPLNADSYIHRRCASHSNTHFSALAPY